MWICVLPLAVWLFQLALHAFDIWQFVCWIKSKLVGEQGAVQVDTGEKTTRTVMIQTKGHYSWDAKRPCVTDLKNKEDGLWEILIVDGVEYRTRLELE